jgi:hypothetical protein
MRCAEREAELRGCPNDDRGGDLSGEAIHWLKLAKPSAYRSNDPPAAGGGTN